MLSTRIKKWIGGEDPYTQKFAEAYNAAVDDLWHETNESGSFVYCRAENKLTAHVADKLNRAESPFPASKLGYEDYKGSQQLRESVSRYMRRHICETDVKSHNLLISAGCGVVIENLIFAVAEQGDKCLVPAPYYSQFDRDLGMRAGVEIKRVHSPAMDHLSASAFEDAWDPSCKVLLLTNPSNPLGTVFHRQELESILTWAHEKNLHVISDEIYACSVYDRGDGDCDSDGGFVSCIDLVRDLGLPQSFVERSVHTVFGFSKDFGASGLRIGCVHSLNPELARAWNYLGYSCAISTHTQHAFAQILDDESFVTDLLATSRTRLAQAGGLLKAELRRAGIPFVGNPTAALFVLIDLRALLGERTWEAERELWAAAVAQGVVLNPGELCGCKEPGYFRLCFAWMRDPERGLPTAVQRLARLKRKS